MKRKIYRVFLMLLFLVIILMNGQFINATLGGNVNEEGILKPIVTNPGNERVNNIFITISSTVVIALQVLGVAGLAINGFKYMSAGAEAKGKIKGNIIWILFGVLLITSANAIINIIANAGSEAFK